MKHNFIIDKEINLDEYDFLKTKVYADNLTRVIKNTEKDKVFTIGLFGNWGTGKSSIIETSKQDFDPTKIKFITYDAWQYANDSFRRMFLRKLREDLRYEETDLMKKFYENESTDIGYKYQLSFPKVLIILIALIALVIFLSFIPFELEKKLSIYTIVSLLGLIITVISGAFHQLKLSVSKPHLFAPEQFEECFKEIVSNSLRKTNKALKWVKNDKSIQNLEKLVIVIDNIDRCSNDIAYNLITDIKTFLGTEPYSTVFVIPVDDMALRKHIINNNKNAGDCDKDKEEFLRKVFNVTIRIKPYSGTDMFAFAKQISDRGNLHLKSETINIVSKEYAKNPRRIIQLFNNLLAELNHYDAEFVQQNETLICCILIVREEYPDYYNDIVNSPKQFIDGSVDQKYSDETLERFIRIVHNTLIKVDISDLSRILTNSHSQFDDIDIGLKENITTYHKKKVLEIWNSATDSEKMRIIEFIVHHLDHAKKYQLIDTVVAYLNLILEINKKFELAEYSATRIDEEIIPYLPKIIPSKVNYENLCNYAQNRNDHGSHKLKKALIEHFNKDEKPYWQSLPLFAAVLKAFNDKDASIDLSLAYTELSKSVKDMSFLSEQFGYKDFSQEQFEYLLSDKFIQQKIKKLPKSNQKISYDINAKEYKEIKYLLENKKNISTSCYGDLVTHLGENQNNTLMHGKSINGIAEFLEFVNPLLNFIPDSKLLDQQPQALYNLVVTDRKMPHPIYSTQEPKNFVDECILADKHIQEIIDFVVNIYRITNNGVNTTNEIKKMIAKYRQQLNKKFIELIDKDISIEPVLDLIFEDTDYQSINTQRLLTHCLNQKVEGEYQITEGKAKKKLDELLTFAQRQKSEEVYELLTSLVEQERYKAILSDLIIEKDCDFINSLPQSFQKLAVGTFTKDNFIDFANNFDFLKTIIQHGDNTQKVWVVRIVITNLDNDENTEQVFDLIDTMEDISSFDPSGLLYSHLDKYLRDNNEILDEDTEQRIQKILKTCKDKTIRRSYKSRHPKID